MASNLYIAEYSAPPYSVNATQMAIAREPALVDQTPVSVGASSTQSAAFTATTNMVRLHNDGGGACVVLFGTNPTATTSSKRLAANQTEYFYTAPGQKVAALAVS